MFKQSNTKHACVLKTGRIHELDMAANALTENDIPFFKQQENVSGLKLAMPFQPAMGPGTFYNILVPEQYFDEAKKIMEAIPIDLTEEPDLFHFTTDEKSKKRWKVFVWFILAVALFFMVCQY